MDYGIIKMNFTFIHVQRETLIKKENETKSFFATDVESISIIELFGQCAFQGF
jgi:hypothetical protein